MDNKVKQLIDILHDATARIDEKDDAAIYLAKYPTKSVLGELVLFASNPMEDEIVLASLGESIGEIMIANNKFEIDFIEKLTPIARQEVLGIIQRKKTEWLKNNKNT